MKVLLFIILTGLIHFQVFTQSDYNMIKVADNVELIKLSENAYIHISYLESPNYGRIPANGLIFISNGDALVIDSPWTDSLTMDLFSYLTDSMNLRIAGFIPNHWHIDCMGGLGYIKDQKIETYANQMTIDIAKSKNLPVPDHGFKDSLQLHLGDKIIKCFYLGAAHSLDNIVVWIPSERILFAGCMIKSLNSRNLGNTTDGDLIAYPVTIDKLINNFKDAKIVIPGHGQFGGLDLLEHTRELTIDH